MAFRVSAALRFLAPAGLVLFSASAAHAQRIPEVVVWSAGAGLFAPFVAVPVKLGVLRLRDLEASARLWSTSALEWLLWFPLGFALLRFGRSPPLGVVVLLALAVWLNKARTPGASWLSALFLSMPTPVLALLLPFLAFAATVLVESLAV